MVMTDHPDHADFNLGHGPTLSGWTR
jgi:hypothetical protein